MKFTLEIKLGNEAMCEPIHVAETLRYVADYLEKREQFPEASVLIRDANGNVVGQLAVSEESCPGQEKPTPDAPSSTWLKHQLKMSLQKEPLLQEYSTNADGHDV